MSTAEEITQEELPKEVLLTENEQLKLDNLNLRLEKLEATAQTLMKAREQVVLGVSTRIGHSLAGYNISVAEGKCVRLDIEKDQE